VGRRLVMAPGYSGKSFVSGRRNRDFNDFVLTFDGSVMSTLAVSSVA
jgi:hypothetical protein